MAGGGASKTPKCAENRLDAQSPGTGHIGGVVFSHSHEAARFDSWVL
jgi:hypothetical protein